MTKRSIVRTLLICLCVAPLMLLVLFMPSGAHCHVASAQTDNPCLAQEATNSALRLREFDLQATIAALETEVAPLRAAASGLVPFRDDFNNNDSGWAVGATAEGAVEIRNGALNIAPSADRAFFVLVPNVETRGNFFMETSITDGVINRTEVGFFHGDYIGNRYYTFVSRFWSPFTGILFYENGTQVVSREGQYVDGGDVMQLERIDGVYNFYINGTLSLSYPAESLGNQLGFAAYNNFGDSTFAFDYLVLRETR